MSAAIEAFKRLVITYFRNVKAGGVECRLVIPGLTPSLSINLHELLKSEDLPSVLVVPRSTPPSREHGLIHAEGLTSIRQGDMLIVTCPGELSKLQDGISGAGGAIRNFAVSDEWPWIDDGNEYFRFRTMFLRELFKLWSVGQSDKKWLNSVAKSLVTSSQASLDRAALLLEDVLGSFSPSLYGDLPTVREKFLFHAGLPRPAGDVLTSDADQFIEQLNDLSKLVRRARVEQDFRGDVLSRIDRLESDPAKQELLVSQVNALLDGLAINAERQYSGALVLRGCWTGDVLRWSSLTIDRLISLFSPVAGSSKLQMKVKLTVKSGLLSPDERSAVIFENSDLSFTVSVDGLSEPDLKSAVVRIVQGSRNIIPETPITICRDTIILNVAYRDVFPRDSKKSRTIRVQMSIGGVIQIEVPVKVTACFHDSPLVVVSDPGFKVIAGKSQAQDDESVWESIETTGNVSLTAVTFDSMETVDVSVEQNPVSLEIDGEDARIRRLSRVIDPSVSPSGRYGVVIESDSAICRVEIEASTAERGEFTLERELIVRLAEGNKARLTKLVEVFVGSTSEAYPYLGGLSDATRARSSLIEAFESGSGGGLPVLADLFGGAPAVLPSLTGMVWVWGHVQSGRLGIFNPSSEITEILDLYFQARRKVVFEISQGVPPPEGRWPAYAWYPTFVDKRRNIIESALVGYLEQFIAVNDFLVKKGAELRWEDAFLLANLDRVVHWAGASESGRFSLVGPWHPLMIAKRFMTQETALASVRRFLANATNKSGIATNKLAILLDQIQAFRWIPMLSPDGVEFDHAYVSATSDPGWMAAISAEVLDKASTEIFVTSIRRSLGLSVTLLPVAQERMAAGFFRQFQNAHPTRRSISLSAEPIYSGDRLISSAEDFLYEGEELSASGRLLPGGLHLFLNEADGLRPIHWRDPPICVYKINEASSWQESYRDIHLLAPAKPRLSRSGGNEQPFARASGDKSVFAGAVHKITVGAGGVPRSFAYERDIRGRPERTIGDLFVSALNLQAVMAGPSRTAGWAIDLPENLKFRWNVIPGSQIDPAVLVHYSRTGFDVGESRVLWDYNMSLTGPASSYFVLSKVPESVTVALGGSPVLAGQGDGAKVIRELAEVGLAIGSESLQTGAKALGVIGTVAAIRLLKGWGDICGPITSSQRSRGFILPVDSFREILGAGLDVESVEGLDARRADLIAFRLSLNNDDHLFISFSAIECKYSSYSFSEEGAQSALEQAQRTYDRLLYLAELARSTSGIPERLALLHLISFGLRLNCAADDAGLAIDQLIIQKLIDGDYSIREPLSPAAVFITECLGKAPSWKKTSGLEVRVCPGHWPGVNDTPELVLLRQYLQGLLGRFAERQEPEKKNGVPSGTDVSSVKKSSVGSPPQSDEPVRAIGGDRMALPSFRHRVWQLMHREPMSALL